MNRRYVILEDLNLNEVIYERLKSIDTKLDHLNDDSSNFRCQAANLAQASLVVGNSPYGRQVATRDLNSGWIVQLLLKL